MLADDSRTDPDLGHGRPLMTTRGIHVKYGGGSYTKTIGKWLLLLSSSSNSRLFPGGRQFAFLRAFKIDNNDSINSIHV